jgi:pyruvate dehydrogenase E2 component (dihydrolipoamide acetyltransferase)
MFSFAVAKALAKFPAFRTTLVNEQTLRTYHHANLGIAVSLPGDELVLAVVNEADTLDWQTFAMSMRERIEFARAGNDQANETVTLSLTNMQSFGLRDAVPVVVPPSVGTLFLGEVYNGLAQDTSELRLQRCANVTLTFDHRVINGVGAAQFLAAVKANVEGIRELLR